MDIYNSIPPTKKTHVESVSEPKVAVQHVTANQRIAQDAMVTEVQIRRIVLPGSHVGPKNKMNA